MLHLLTQPKEGQQQIKKKKQKQKTELTENQTVWISNNQGVKEETFIQTGRRGREGQLGGENMRQGGWWTGYPHIHVQINWEEQLGSKTDFTT